MRVLLLSHMYPNPARPTDGIFVHELAKVLSKNCQLSVLAPIPFFPFLVMTSKYRRFSSIPPRDASGDFDIRYPRFFFIPKFLKFTDWFGYLVSVFPVLLAMRDKFDIIYVHWGYPDGLAAIICAKLLNKKVVLHVHGNESVCFFERSLRKLLVKAYVSKVDHIIAVSSDLKEKLIKFYDVESEAISVIFNGIDTKVFTALSKTEAREHLCLPAHSRILVSVSRLSGEKRLDMLIEAFSILSHTFNNDARLYIIGDGPEKKNLESLSRSKGNELASKIRFVGNVLHQQVPNWLSAADIVCLSSDREGCPVSVIEALGCERPVVATRVGAVPDLIANDDYGFVVSPGRPDDLAEALNTALSKVWDYDKIGSRARTFTWERTADAVMGVFRRLS